MTIQILTEWDNSPAIRIPLAILESAHLTLEQKVEVRAEDGRIIIEPLGAHYQLEDLLQGITQANRHVEVDFGAREGQEAL